MSYKIEFEETFDLGFDLKFHPKLIDKSWHNDVCPSFYFKVSDCYYVLWVDFRERNRREYDGARYTIVSAENLGCDKWPEITCGQDCEVVFSTEDAGVLSIYLASILH